MKRQIVLLLLAAVLVACSSPSLPVPGPQEIGIEATEFSFTPAAIEVVAGQPVKVAFQNTGALEHDFSILEIPATVQTITEAATGHSMDHMAETPAVHVAAMASQGATLEFTPTAPGTYEFFCTVAGHKEAGMRGTLVVKVS